MGGMRRHDSPTSVPRPPTQRVGFADEVVTGYSRPVTNDEHWTLYYFEDHAANCSQCHDPYRVHKSGNRLCDKGHELAINVARIVYYSKSRDGVFSRNKEDQQEIRVEIPAKYVETLGLLQAIQRALRYGEHWLKPQSYDKTYLVPPRHQHTDYTGHSSSDESKSSQRSRGSSSSEYETRIAEPKPRQRSRRDSMLDDSKRGSLYAKDMSELLEQHKREQKLKYNLEVRQPSSRRHSVYPG